VSDGRAATFGFATVKRSGLGLEISGYLASGVKTGDANARQRKVFSLAFFNAKSSVKCWRKISFDLFGAAFHQEEKWN
jgi:hypothetical protein